MSSNKIERMICRLCDEVHPFAGANDNGLPKTFPAFKVAQPLRLNPDVFARLYPKAAAEENTFVIAGALSDRFCRRTVHCVVSFDRARLVHRYKIMLRWTGDVGNIKEQRIVAVWAEDVKAGKGGE